MPYLIHTFFGEMVEEILLKPFFIESKTQNLFEIKEIKPVF